MAVSEASLRLAVANVANWGDTDVLPFPLENHWFYDAPDDVVGILTDIDRDFDQWISHFPVFAHRALNNVGYAGYRATTQIEPIWNAYLLALAIEIAPDIEAGRIPTDQERIFSYRFAPDQESYSLFNREIGWHSFQESALTRASENGFVLSTDISNFYPRIYHHRIENSLAKATGNQDAVKRVMDILKRLNPANVSYGLPIGGNAARIFAEAVLTRTDRLLLTKGIEFCRFVDDYLIFGDSEEDARNALLYLNEVLLDHEGLSLSRMKTRLMTTAEFQRKSAAAPPEEADSEPEEQARHFLKIRLKYDPYSPTADEDYEELADELRRFDVLGMLSREFRKTRVDESLTKQLVRSLRFLDGSVQADAIATLVENLHILFPLFPTVAIVLRQTLPDLEREDQARVFKSLRDLLRSGSHVLKVSSNLAFAVRILARDPSDESEVALANIYDRHSHPIIRRDVVLAMVARRCDHWVADRLRDWPNLIPWERRALLPGSFILGDEGRHWRQNRKSELNAVDSTFLGWLSSKNDGALWALPV